MSEFHIKLGKRDAATGRHVEPTGLDGAALSDWRKGHGVGWIERPATQETRTLTTSTLPPVRDARPYTPFSTAATKRRAKTASADRLRTSGKAPNRLSAATCVPKPEARSPKPVLGLFGVIEDEIANTKTPTKKPNPIPDAHRDKEKLALMNLGILVGDAENLIANDWTLDQLAVRWDLERLHAKRLAAAKAAGETLDELPDLPEFVRQQMPLVDEWCQQKFSPKQGSSPNVSPRPQTESGNPDCRAHQSQSA